MLDSSDMSVIESTAEIDLKPPVTAVVTAVKMSNTTIVKMSNTTPVPVKMSTTVSLDASNSIPKEARSIPTTSIRDTPRDTPTQEGSLLSANPTSVPRIAVAKPVVKSRHSKQHKRQRACPCCDPDNIENLLDKMIFMDQPPM